MITPKRTFDHVVEDNLKYLKPYRKKRIIGRAKKVRKVGLCETAQNSDEGITTVGHPKGHRTLYLG